jgi:membrane protein
MVATTSLFHRGRRRAAARAERSDRPAVARRSRLDVARRVAADMKADDAPLLAAGVAFYALLALVPALVALVSTYGMVADPADIERNVDDVLSAAPTEVRDLVQSQLSSIVEGSSSGLRLGVIVGLALALWAASSGVKNLMTAVNRAYHERESRGFLKLRGTALVMTLGFTVLAAAVFMGLIVGPRTLDTAGTEGLARDVLMIVCWPLAAIALVLGLAVIYRFGPDRPTTRWRWGVSPGALLATALWLAASVGFSIYTANVGKYNETYGALGAIVVVMLWLWLGALAVIVGAEVNGEVDRPAGADPAATGPEYAGDAARARSDEPVEVA